MSKSWRSTIRPEIHLIELKNIPIFEQLQLEEALLRSDERSFCIINHGSPRAIVMGISGEPHTLLNIESVKKENIPVYKRFSGGGTVIVDENTLFITFIIAKDHLIEIPAFPEPILRWSADLYKEAWKLPHFALKENDYCIGEKKCGGNAQYIKKDRWLHHTSFLWDYSEANMKHLFLPPKRPKYRQGRPHSDFLTPLHQHAKSLETLITHLKETLVKRLYMTEFDLDSWQPGPHRKSAHKIDF